MDAHAIRPRPLGHAAPQRLGFVRRMVSMPLMKQTHDTTYSSGFRRLSEEDLDDRFAEHCPPVATPPIIPEYDNAHTKQSLKEFLKDEPRTSTTKSSDGASASRSYKKSHLRMDLLNWFKEKHTLKRTKHTSTSSSGSGLDPALTCRGLPSMMLDEESTLINSSIYSSSPISPSFTTTSQTLQQTRSRFSDRTDSSNLNNLDTDANDESLQRYKQSLGLSGGKDLSDPNDPRVCIIHSLAMESPGRAPVIIDLSAPGSESTLKDRPFKIKEGSKFTMVATFKVQHEILSGLQYVQLVKRKGIKVSKDSEMLGSYAPNTDKQPLYSKRFQEEEAPSGMLARGHYNATSSFVDDDKKTHLQFEWSFDISKDW
ncbi:immunoglobulin E-set [Daldinia vernicosa]|uniref:immunoglobulin E-set n=1 Tax=Daldinia vernicosa TaxID=114800 RepID=UPI002008CE82|nr:immunoglobulin E-set [Daldinia vernicosa]KAI0844196.1 immunoglobulin E-set [Daldinia vernicosa]